ncbi:substrate-binding domain-containing protein [Aurantiacibacter gangjinensis]|uniref:Phosphate ABC transporter substrate-binding protein n=1 Tax=Aurantiacibacter gangjinensis TaxID=502682 RepID=A0A0G9MPZ3_9SPHN|nr:substrate-binding domain-containing protein [Aurantiacibacter gangjinensis]APE28616.1 Phosphate ABC transporter, periplasmic phosphate-binding protein PstS [Aurantiacibacter gangjinensis]KLE32801.1 phosphate ABC transporter substrate-binding protein [Aurantiacibacter gangjinensis]
MKKITIAAVALAATALTACGNQPGADSGREGIHAVGSSTVFPFARRVSEIFSRENPDFAAASIESTGTGGGMALFCSGTGFDTPDMVNASRRMKPGEFETCQENGVTEITELQVGMDGIAIASAIGGIQMDLSPEIMYRALAANPYGEEQTNTNWSDVDPSLPDLPILVYGPPTTSGTRDAFNELIMLVGCEANEEFAATEEADEDAFERTCTEMRSDGAFVDQGEQDNLIVQKIEGNTNSVGIFGYSYLEENSDRVRGQSINGVEPTYENIASFEYPGARPLYVYVKKEHVGVIPGLAEFLQTWAANWGEDGPLAQIGLVTNRGEVMAQMTNAIDELPNLTAEDLQ